MNRVRNTFSRIKAILKTKQGRQVLAELVALRDRAVGTHSALLEFQAETERLNKEIINIQSELAHVKENLTNIINEISVGFREIGTLKEQLSTLQTDISHQNQFFRKSTLALRYHACCHTEKTPLSPAKLGQPLPISDQFKRLQEAAPHAYRLWRPLLEANKEAYMGTPIDSCSVHGHPMATLFRFFITPYLKGKVLDIGCGPQRLPIYLEGHPVEAIYGVDPISEPENHEFQFFSGLAEYLPWAEDQFDLVVAATSLDHVLLLDKTLFEISRVLSGSGTFVVWVGFVPGAKPYDPFSKDIEPLDSYHLFHFDRDWFREAIKPYFTILEEFAVDVENYFYALRPRRTLNHDG